MRKIKNGDRFKLDEKLPNVYMISDILYDEENKCVLYNILVINNCKEDYCIKRIMNKPKTLEQIQSILENLPDSESIVFIDDY